MESDRLFAVLRRFAATMARRFEINDVLHELAEHTTEVLGASGAGVSVEGDGGRLRFVSATSERITEVERVQDDLQQGACVAAFLSGEPVMASTPAEFDAWPVYRDTMTRVGLGSVVGLPLTVDGHRIGSLDVYDEAGRQWSESDLTSAHVLGDVACAYLLRAGELAEARQMSAQLQKALDSRIVIEQAKGMLSRDHKITVDEAFELLRDYSRSHNSNLRAVAERIVHQNLQIPDPG